MDSADEFYDRSASAVVERFRADAARWIVPEELSDPADVDLWTLLRLLRRHRQFRAMVWFRLGDWAHGAARVRGLTWFCEQRMEASYGLDLAPNVEVLGGFYLAHPNGTAINAARIGRNVTVVGSVTVGLRGEGLGPRLGDDVFIGAGARVLGSIEVGGAARIGANAVVLDDVPAGATMVGIPAVRVR